MDTTSRYTIPPDTARWEVSEIFETRDDERVARELDRLHGGADLVRA